MQEFISDITELFPRITERKVYKIICSMKARHKKYGTFGLGKRDGFRFGISERQMQYFVKAMLDYGFLEIDKEVRSSRGFKCRVFRVSSQLKVYFSEIKDYVFKKFEYINPTEYVKSKFLVVKRGSKLVFKVSGIKYHIATRGKFKGVIFDTANVCIVNPLTLNN